MNRKRSSIKTRCQVHGCTRTKEKDDERCLFHVRAKYGGWLNAPARILSQAELDTNDEIEV